LVRNQTTTSSIERTSYKPSRETAFHEAGHCIHALAQNWTVLGIEPGVELGENLRHDVCRFIVPNGADEAAVENFLAGPIAEYWSRRWIVKPHASHLRPYVERARAGSTGGCDHCRIFGLLLATDPEQTNDHLISRYRAYFDRALDFIRRGDVWRPIGRVADAYQAKGRLDAFDILDAVDTADSR
jgi:hypothetical protein